MVRAQVAVMMSSMGQVSKATDALRADVNALGSAVGTLRDHVAALGGMMTTLAEAADDHEERLSALEKKKGKA
jgi:hypothetical protein